MLIEFTLWFAIFRGVHQLSIGGYAREYYLSYVLWAAFVARITSSWMYEFKMIEEVDSGSINGLLVRPMTFYEYYLSQLLGYKLITSVLSLIFPITVAYLWHLPTDFSRLPLALLLVTYFLILVHTISYCVTGVAFFINKVHSLTVAKNLGLWLLSGELFPLDLLPPFWRHILLNLPFSSAVYVPVGFVTGRVGISDVLQGFYSVTLGIVFFALLGNLLWTKGMRDYTGTGA